MGQALSPSCRGYKVLNHINGTAAPPKNDPSYETWNEIDDIVLQWIYGTLSDELLVRVLEHESTANEAWLRVKSIFHNNKGSRAAALEQAFSNHTLQSMDALDDYCQKLKTYADQLADVECPVAENRLVLQLVRGLPPEFDTVASDINQTLPSWESACDKLRLEVDRLKARENAASHSALTAAAVQPKETVNRNNSSRPNSSHSRSAPRRQHPNRGTPNRQNSPSAPGKQQGSHSNPWNHSYMQNWNRPTGHMDRNPYWPPPWWATPHRVHIQRSRGQIHPPKTFGRQQPNREPPQAHITLLK